MQSRYPNNTPDQRTTPESSAYPDDALRPTAPIRPRALDDESTLPVEPVQPAQRVERVQPVQPVEPVQRVAVVTSTNRAAMVIWLVLGVVEALLIMRVVLKALAANPATWFVQLVYSASAPLVAPFQGIFPTRATAGSVFELSSLVAIVVYALIAWGIVRILAILDSRQDQSTM